MKMAPTLGTPLNRIAVVCPAVRPAAEPAPRLSAIRASQLPPPTVEISTVRPDANGVRTGSSILDV